MGSKESLTTVAKRAIQQESAQKAKKEESKKEKETAPKGKAEDHGVGEREFGKWTEKNPKEIGSGINRRRKNQQEASSRLEGRG